MKIDDVERISRLARRLENLRTKLSNISELDVSSMYPAKVSGVADEGIRFKFNRSNKEIKTSESWQTACRSILMSTKDLIEMELAEVEDDLQKLGVDFEPRGGAKS